MQPPTKDNTSDTAGYRLPQELPLETPFWAFSLSIWNRPAARSALLSLQDDAGLAVNLLLFCSWLGAEQREIVVKALFGDRLLRHWQQQTVIPLRALRRRLQIEATQQPQFIRTLQDAEVQAEQIEQALLFERTTQVSRPTTKQNRLATLSYNLLSYTQEELGGAALAFQPTRICPHLVTLTHAAIPDYDRSQIEVCFS